MFEFLFAKTDVNIVDDMTVKVHDSTDIYLDWQFPKIVEKGFTCQICGEKKNIHVEYKIDDLREIVKQVNETLNPTNRIDCSVKYKIKKAVISELNEANSINYSVLCENCT